MTKAANTLASPTRGLRPRRLGTTGKRMAASSSCHAATKPEESSLGGNPVAGAVADAERRGWK